MNFVLAQSEWKWQINIHPSVCLLYVNDMLDKAWNPTHYEHQIETFWASLYSSNFVLRFLWESFFHSHFYVTTRSVLVFRMREPQQLWNDSSQWHIPIESILDFMYVNFAFHHLKQRKRCQVNSNRNRYSSFPTSYCCHAKRNRGQNKIVTARKTKQIENSWIVITVCHFPFITLNTYICGMDLFKANICPLKNMVAIQGYNTRIHTIHLNANFVSFCIHHN